MIHLEIVNGLQLKDYIVFLIYFLVGVFYGLYVYNKKKKSSISASHDYFLAEGSLSL